MSYKVQKPCKVCGKMYTPCADCERDKHAFHWRTVACSVECGSKWFKMVEEARSSKSTMESNDSKIVEVAEEKPKKKTSKRKPTIEENKESE